jgi:hypothetical protein
MSEQIKLFTMSIDTECDHQPDWSRANPLTFENITDGIPNRLQPLFADVGAIPTYLLTVEVMEDEESVATLKSVDSDAVEFGTHLHAAFVEPEKKFHDYAGVDSPDFQSNCSPDVEFKKLENITRLFVEKFGYAPRSFRAGRFGAGPNTLDSLERLNYHVDSSVTPRLKWHEPNGCVDFRRAPLQLYTPQGGDIGRADTPGARRILEIPVSMRPRFARSPSWLRPWLSDVRTMKGLVHHHLKRHTKRPIVVLNMMFHSMEVIPKASPYPQSESDVRKFTEQLRQILGWCSEQGFQFSALKDVRQKFVEAHSLDG